MRVLFVCTGNTCRSPMAERLGRLLFPLHTWESAGVLPTQDGIHPLANQVLIGLGADGNSFISRHVGDCDLGGFTHLVLIGTTAMNLTPAPPSGVAVEYWEVADPFEATGALEERFSQYRACAAELVKRINTLVAPRSPCPTPHN